MRRLAAGWYVVLYHDVSWEESAFVRHIGGTCAPDVFRDHVRACSHAGQIVSIEDGMARLEKNEIDRPLISFWFDDGLVGVRKFASPILEEYGVTGAISICSRFLNRQEMFWRFKLSYLQSIDAGRHLRSKLRQYGYSSDHYVRNFTLDRFDDDVLSTINTLYDEVASEATRQDAFRVFDGPQGLLDLHARGWIIANHSAGHYPIGEAHVMGPLIEQFEECEGVLAGLIGAATKYWVFPFDKNVLDQAVRQVRESSTRPVPVLVRNRANVSSRFASERAVVRIDAPVTSRDRLLDVLGAAARATP